MGKTGKWIKNLLIGKKEKDRGGGGGGGSRGGKEIYSTPTTPIATSTPKERKRWSFRRSSKESNSMDYSTGADSAMLKQAMLDSENEQKKQALVMAAATAAAADAAVAAAQAAATVIHLTVAAENRRRSAVEEAAAIKIQSVFRSHLARKALRALKGLVKLQALVRGHLVRKQAATTIRCMQALLNVQARARAKRMLMAEETESLTQRLSNNSKSYRNSRFRQTYNMERGIEDDVKVVEMDIGQSRLSSKSRRRYSTGTHVERADQRFSPHYHSHSNQDYLYQMSPGASTLTDMTPRAYSFDATQTPLSAEYISQDCEIIPNYMTNTESFKAKARSQSAPKQRPELYERQSSRRKPSNVPRGIRMQRSSSQVGSTGSWYQFPWSIQLNRSIMSLQDSECGSTSTVITNTTNYCKSLVAYEVGNY